MKGATVASADDKASQNFRLLLLSLMVLQNSFTVLVGRYTRSSVSADESFIVNNFLVVTEFSKLVLAAIFEFYVTNGKLYQSIHEHIISQPLDFLRIAIPALLYLIQNTLLYVALSNLSAPLFQVTYQGKLLTTALISVILLNRRYNFRQWVCLATLGMGVAVVVLSEPKKQKAVETVNEQDVFVGLVAVIVACLCSAMAGVYFERVLKKKNDPVPVEGDAENGVAAVVPRQPPSLWLRNIQLAFFSIITASLRLFMDRQRSSDIEPKPFFHGFNAWVWTLVALQAGGGLLVAAVMKYADNVLKGMATGVAVCFTSVCSLVLFGTQLRFFFIIGASVILVSVYFFSNDLPSFGRNKSKVSLPTTGGNDTEEVAPILSK